MAEANETSPLLAVETNHAEGSNSQDDITSFPEITTYTAARDYFPRPIKVLTWSILISSAISFIVLVATDILVTNAPFTSYYWSTTRNIEATATFVLIAFVAAVTNLRVKFPILFNFIIDIFLVINFLGCVPEMFGYSYPNSGWCVINRYDPVAPSDPETKPGCLPWVLAAMILMGVGGGLAALVGVFHLVLLLLRVVAAWKSKFWRRPSILSLPTGELTLQFTIKLLKQETVATAPLAAASSPLSAQTPANGR